MQTCCQWWCPSTEVEFWALVAVFVMMLNSKLNLCGVSVSVSQAGNNKVIIFDHIYELWTNGFELWKNDSFGSTLFDLTPGPTLNFLDPRNNRICRAQWESWQLLSHRTEPWHTRFWVAGWIENLSKLGQSFLAGYYYRLNFNKFKSMICLFLISNGWCQN